MNKTIQVILNEGEQQELEEIRDYFQKLFGQKISTSMLLRFIIQKEWNAEHGIELVVEK